MEFEVLYNLKFSSFDLLFLLIPIGLIIIGLYAIRVINRYGFVHPMQSWGFYKNMDFSMFGKFFAFLFVFFGAIISIVMLIQIPSDLIEQRRVQEIIENKDYRIVEGKVANFSPYNNLDQRHESFEISGICFSYSDYDKIYGYSKTSKNGGIINSNGQYFRICYYSMDGHNIICKIEGVKNH